MKHIKQSIINCCLLLIAVTLNACYDDEGNYNYSEVPEITVENIPETTSVLRGIGTLNISPRIVSSTEGEIAADNPNYEFGCKIAHVSGRFSDDEMWHDINPDRTQSFTTSLEESVGDYVGLYTVTDKRTGVTTNYRFGITIITSTSEGWMVLCNEGADNKVRLDMVSVLDVDNIVPMYDLLGDGIPTQYNAKQLFFFKQNYNPDNIYMLTGTGAYSLDPKELTASETGNVMKSEFLADLGDELPERMAACGSSYHYLVSNAGNIYRKDAYSAGGVYEFPCNADTDGGTPTYRVSPYVAAAANYGYLVLVFDVDNRRFMSQYIYGTSSVFGSILEPENPLFSWSPNKDLVYMERTMSNIAYAVMQGDDGSRSIYAISLSGWTPTNMTQQGCWDNITAEGFATAEHFAFHETYPYVFYSNGSTLYAYQMEGGGSVSSVNLPGEEITMVKITSTGDREDWNEYILVGSYRDDAADDNGGILRMYTFDRTSNTFVEAARYEGFAKIVDVAYRGLDDE